MLHEFSTLRKNYVSIEVINDFDEWVILEWSYIPYGLGHY